MAGPKGTPQGPKRAKKRVCDGKHTYTLSSAIEGKCHCVIGTFWHYMDHICFFQIFRREEISFFPYYKGGENKVYTIKISKIGEVRWKFH